MHARTPFETVGLAVVLFGAACDRSDAKPLGTQPSASVAASTSAPPALVDSGPTIAKWAGAYTAAPGSFFVPDAPEFKGVKFRGEDAGDGLGEGTLAFEVDPVTHVIAGEVHGALGDLVLGGARLPTTGPPEDEVYAFTVRPKDPSGMGFTGTGRATLKGAEVAGTLRVSKATANVIREATFSLKRQ